MPPKAVTDARGHDQRHRHTQHTDQAVQRQPGVLGLPLPDTTCGQLRPQYRPEARIRQQHHRRKPHRPSQQEQDRRNSGHPGMLK